MYTNATPTQIDQAVANANEAFINWRHSSLRARADLLHAIAATLEQAAPGVLESARQETNLQPGRLQVEFNRTLFQLRSYAEACVRGAWLDARIDTAEPQRQPPKPDVRKTLVGLGPVVVFGASNFPFAYSTAGGDTAAALAAGCTVIVKGHPAHAHTSQLVADAIQQALSEQGLPAGIFQHLHGASFEVGKALVLHPQVQAVGFTGSLQGGRALFDLANGRQQPIPVFAEMGSVNPVFILPQKLATDHQQVVEQYANSITMSVGQFCTNPGLLVGVAGETMNLFIQELGARIAATAPEAMLHTGIAQSFRKKRQEVMSLAAVTIAGAAEAGADTHSQPTLATVSGKDFLANSLLHEEIFGPYSLVVQCADAAEMLAVAQALQGQLTTTLMATDAEAAAAIELVNVLQQRCGRIIFNGVPTGVEVCLAMHHGGPYPATTDSRFTSVGADAIRRFARPLCFQNFLDSLLPAELQRSNPLGIWRTLNNELTRGEG